MGGRAFIVTQSVKKLSGTLKKAVFNDYDYRLLSNDKLVSIEDMKTFDRHDKKNLGLYKDFAYKVVEADKATGLRLYEEKTLKNGRTIQVKEKGLLKQRIMIKSYFAGCAFRKGAAVASRFTYQRFLCQFVILMLYSFFVGRR